jgi:hypothetical protein
MPRRAQPFSYAAFSHYYSPWFRRGPASQDWQGPAPFPTVTIPFAQGDPYAGYPFIRHYPRLDAVAVPAYARTKDQTVTGSFARYPGPTVSPAPPGFAHMVPQWAHMDTSEGGVSTSVFDDHEDDDDFLFGDDDDEDYGRRRRRRRRRPGWRRRRRRRRLAEQEALEAAEYGDDDEWGFDDDEFGELEDAMVMHFGAKEGKKKLRPFKAISELFKVGPSGKTKAEEALSQAKALQKEAKALVRVERKGGQQIDRRIQQALQRVQLQQPAPRQGMTPVQTGMLVAGVAAVVGAGVWFATRR